MVTLKESICSLAQQQPGSIKKENFPFVEFGKGEKMRIGVRCAKHLIVHLDVLGNLESVIKQITDHNPDGDNNYKAIFSFTGNQPSGILKRKIPLTENDNMFFGNRKGRNTFSVFIHPRDGEVIMADQIVIIYKPTTESGVFDLVTAFFGASNYEAPKEPGDKTLDESEFSKSIEFWCTYGFPVDNAIPSSLVESTWKLILAE